MQNLLRKYPLHCAIKRYLNQIVVFTYTSIYQTRKISYRLFVAMRKRNLKYWYTKTLFCILKTQEVFGLTLN